MDDTIGSINCFMDFCLDDANAFQSMSESTVVDLLTKNQLLLSYQFHLHCNNVKITILILLQHNMNHPIPLTLHFHINFLLTPLTLSWLMSMSMSMLMSMWMSITFSAVDRNLHFHWHCHHCHHQSCFQRFYKYDHHSYFSSRQVAVTSSILYRTYDYRSNMNNVTWT